MKNFPLVISVLVGVANLSAQNPIALSDLRQPHQIAVDGNDLYIFDEADYSLHVYSISPFASKGAFGRKGDGPRDFKYLPFVFIQPESLACTDFTKMIWFSRSGEVLKVKEFLELKDFDLNSEMILMPVKENFLRITADHNQHKRRVNLLDSKWKTIKNLYEGLFVWESGEYISARTDTLSSQGLVFVANTERFEIAVFDDKGTLLRTIDKSKDVEKVPGRALLHQFCVSDDKIYATTYLKKDGQTEMLILDFQGRILRRIYLPLASIRPERGVLRYDLFTVGRGKLYELIQSREGGKWGLLITDLESIR